MSSDQADPPVRRLRLGRRASFVLVLAVYASAAAVGLGAAHMWGGDATAALSVSFVASTLAVFAWSVGTGNSSCFDAWWSAAPGLAVWLLPSEGGARAWLVRALVTAWALRLTWNWARGWPGLVHEDWRYVDLRNKSGRAWWLVSLLAIHLFPCALVLLGSLPMVPALAHSTPLDWLGLVGVLVAGCSIAIETLADEQLRAFTQSKPPRDAIMQTGLWAYSRHPNYLGEVGFWWGLALIALGAGGEAWVVAGALSITALFMLASIPMMEKRHAAKRPAYADYQRRVPMLFPWKVMGRRS